MAEQSTEKRKIPAVKGWFTMPPEEPKIIASQCLECKDIFFPPGGVCKNPTCSKGENVEKILLKGKGKLEAFTINHYPPPPPFHASKPFVPFGVVMVLMEEGLFLKGMVVPGFEKDLKVGMDLEICLDRLYEDQAGNEVVTYKFRPIA